MPSARTQILTPRLHNSLIYPNMSIMGLNIHVRVIKPIAVDRTEVTIYPIRLLRRARLHELRQYPAAQRDPFGVVVRADRRSGILRARAEGPARHLTDWVDISRGLGHEEPDRELNATRGLATHEMVVRAQYKAWLGYMREAA